MLVAILKRYKGMLAFALVLTLLSIISISVPPRKSGAADSQDTTSTVARCGVYSCTPKLPTTTTEAPAAPDVVTATPVKSTGSISANGTINWGQPGLEDDFDTFNTATGWFTYDDPDSIPRRLSGNVSAADGFLNVQGTYSAGVQSGAGVAEKYEQKYGRWEVRARGDVGAGFSPTILLWPQNNNWPSGGEIDLLESPHGNRQNAIAALHNKTQGNFKTKGITGNGSDWHTYAVDWTPNRITFYVDNVEQWNVTDPKLIPTTSPMHLVLQNDEGCGWIQCPNSSTKPVTNMQVDWIKVYALPAS